MWLKRFTHYLLSNRLQALVLTFALTSLCVFGMVGCLVASIGIIIAAMITLVKGANEGAVFTTAATLPFAVYYFRGDVHSDAPTVIIWGLLVIVVAINLMTWFMAALLYRRMNWSNVLQVAALAGVLAVSVVHLMNPGIAGWWTEQFTQVQTYITKNIPEMSSLMATTSDQAASNAQTTTTAATTTQTVWSHQPTQSEMMSGTTGALTALVLLFATIQLIIARWWQCAMFYHGLLRKELQNIRLSTLAGLSLLMCLALQVWGNDVVLDILPILSLLFVGAGLSVVHYIVGLMQPAKSWAVILTFYVLLIFVLQQAGMLLLVLLGLTDVWFDLRKMVRKA